MDDFVIYYDGDGLAKHLMGAKSVASAIDGFSAIFEEIDKLSRKQDSNSKITLYIEGTNETDSEAFQGGSFGWLFKILGIGDHDDEMSLLSEESNSGYLGIFKKIIMLVQDSTGRKITVIKSEDGRVSVQFDGQEVDAEPIIGELLLIPKVQKSLESIVRPLNTKGIDCMGISPDIHDKENSYLAVLKNEAKFFQGIEVKRPIASSVSEIVQTFYIETLSYNKGKNWELRSEGFNDGKVISATIKCEDFLERVEADMEEFSKHDSLKVRLKIKHITDEDSNLITTKYTVLTVFEHIKAHKQKNLF